MSRAKKLDANPQVIITKVGDQFFGSAHLDY